MATSERFEIPCPGCGTQVAVSTAHIGKKGRCPQCKTVFPITAPPANATVVAELIPTPALKPLPPGLQPLGNSGLQPLGTPGLQPIGAPSLKPLPPGLQPLPPGLQPLPQPAWQNSSLPNPYGANAPSSPFAPTPPFGQPAAPSVFDDLGKPKSKPSDDEFQLAADPNPYASPPGNSQVQDTFKRLTEKDQWRQEKESGDLNASLWGGIGMMALSVVWFFGGLFFGILFFYPPVLFVVGLVAFVKGLVTRPGQ